MGSIVQSNDADVLELFLKEGGDVDIKDIFGKTPLIYAATGRAVDAVKFLLEHAANPNFAIKNESQLIGLTPLFATLSSLLRSDKKDFIGTVKLLLEYGANVNTTAFNGITPLVDAACSESDQVVRLLLSHPSCNIDIQNIDTALMVAVHHIFDLLNGDQATQEILETGKIINTLIEYGANPDNKHLDGSYKGKSFQNKSALDFAKETGLNDVLEILASSHIAGGKSTKAAKSEE